MEMNRYHKDLHYFVNLIELGECTLTWSRHAMERAIAKRFPQRRHVTINESEVFELEVMRDGTHKYGVRLPHSKTHDLCLILVHAEENGDDHYQVITGWLNAKEDNHATLDTTYYHKGIGA